MKVDAPQTIMARGKMELSASTRRVVSLTLGCANILLAGFGMYSFNTFSEDMKREFGLTQNSVEVISGLGFIGASMGYPAGVIYKNIGSKIFIITTVLGVGGAFLLSTTATNVELYSQVWLILALYWGLFGVCSSFIFYVTFGLNMDNFSSEHRGAIAGLQEACVWGGEALFSFIYSELFAHTEYSVQTFFFFIAIVALVINIPAIWLVGAVYQSDSCKETEAIHDQTELAQSGARAEQVYPEQVHPEQVHPVANEDTPILTHPPCTGRTRAEIWSERMGLDFHKLDFHLLGWSVCLTCVNVGYLNNLTSITSSYGFSHMNGFLTVACPLSAAVLSLTVPPLSDKTKGRFSRILYLIGFSGLQFLLLVFSVQFGDNQVLFIVTTFAVYGVLGVFYALFATLLGDFFGMGYLIRNFGFIFFILAVLSYISMEMFGIFYSSNITDDYSTFCYGLVCIRSYYVLSAVCTFVSLILLVILWVRERNRWKLNTWN